LLCTFRSLDAIGVGSFDGIFAQSVWKVHRHLLWEWLKTG
jgi:hypothetical protein